jgi:hypothetical protein
MVRRPDAAVLRPLGDIFTVSPDGDLPSVAMLPGGDFIVVWQGAGGGTQARRFAADGTPQGSATSVGTGGAGTIAAVGDDEFVLVSSEPTRLVAQFLDRNAAPASSVLPLGFAVTIGLWDVGADAAGNFVVAWTDYKTVSSPPCFGEPFDLFARGFDRSGEPLSAPVLVSPCLGFGTSEMGVGGNPSGDFIVVWEHREPIAQPLVGQSLRADGMLDGQSFAIADSTSYRADVAPDAAQRFVATWSEPDISGEAHVVHARHFDATKSPDSDAFVVAETGYDTGVAITPAGDRVVIVWGRIESIGIDGRILAVDDLTGTTIVPATTTTTLAPLACVSLPACADALTTVIPDPAALTGRGKATARKLRGLARRIGRAITKAKYGKISRMLDAVARKAGKAAEKGALDEATLAAITAAIANIRAILAP